MGIKAKITLGILPSFYQKLIKIIRPKNDKNVELYFYLIGPTGK